MPILVVTTRKTGFPHHIRLLCKTIADKKLFNVEISCKNKIDWFVPNDMKPRIDTTISSDIGPRTHVGFNLKVKATNLNSEQVLGKFPIRKYHDLSYLW